MAEYFKQNKGMLKMVRLEPIAVIPNTLSVLRSDENTTFFKYAQPSHSKYERQRRRTDYSIPHHKNQNGEDNFYMSGTAYAK
jgi:hypothetical protein